MDLRFKFNEDAANYDKYRPIYCDALFRDIIEYTALDAGKTAVEVGIGTGQATKPFLDTGCSLTAIELGQDLAEYAAAKFKDSLNFNVINTAFEDYPFTPGSVDLIYSATAFHWIPEEVGYKKAYDMLKSGGTFALFWNKPFPERPDSPLFESIQQVYDRYRPGSKKPLPYDSEKYRGRCNAMATYGFGDIKFKLYYGTRTFTADEYISLLNTYSDHRSMSGSMRVKFEDELRDVILSFGDKLTIRDTMDLHMGRKP